MKEEVRGSGLRHALGELVTCPFCLGHWVATAYAFGLLYSPRSTRTIAAILCIGAGADALQALDSRLAEA